MSQENEFNIDPYLLSGVDLADMLNKYNETVLSANSGIYEPLYRIEGTLWLDISDYDYVTNTGFKYLKIFNYNEDIDPETQEEIGGYWSIVGYFKDEEDFFIGGGAPASILRLHLNGTNSGTFNTNFVFDSTINKSILIKLKTDFEGNYEILSDSDVNTSIRVTILGALYISVNGVVVCNTIAGALPSDGTYHDILIEFNTDATRIYVDNAVAATSAAVTENFNINTVGAGPYLDNFVGIIESITFNLASQYYWFIDSGSTEFETCEPDTTANRLLYNNVVIEDWINSSDVTGYYLPLTGGIMAGNILFGTNDPNAVQDSTGARFQDYEGTTFAQFDLYDNELRLVTKNTTSTYKFPLRINTEDGVARFYSNPTVLVPTNPLTDDMLITKGQVLDLGGISGNQKKECVFDGQVISTAILPDYSIGISHIDNDAASGGVYRVYFTTPMSNVNYTIAGTCHSISPGVGGAISILDVQLEYFDFEVYSTSAAVTKSDRISIVISGDDKVFEFILDFTEFSFASTTADIVFPNTFSDVAAATNIDINCSSTEEGTYYLLSNTAKTNEDYLRINSDGSVEFKGSDIPLQTVKTAPGQFLFDGTTHIIALRIHNTSLDIYVNGLLTSSTDDSETFTINSICKNIGQVPNTDIWTNSEIPFSIKDGTLNLVYEASDPIKESWAETIKYMVDDFIIELEYDLTNALLAPNAGTNTLVRFGFHAYDATMEFLETFYIEIHILANGNSYYNVDGNTVANPSNVGKLRIKRVGQELMFFYDRLGGLGWEWDGNSSQISNGTNYTMADTYIYTRPQLLSNVQVTSSNVIVKMDNFYITSGKWADSMTLFDEIGFQDAFIEGNVLLEQPSLLTNDADTSAVYLQEVVSYTPNAVFNLTEGTISFIYQALEYPAITSNGILAAISEFDRVGANVSTAIYMTSDGTLRFKTANDDIVSNDIIPLDTTKHIVCCVDATSSRMYINGVLQDDIGTGGSFSSHTTPTFSVGGVQNDTDGWAQMKVLMDEVWCSATILTDEAISFLYDISISECGPIFLNPYNSLHETLSDTIGLVPSESFIANLTVTAGNEYHKIILYLGTQYDFIIDWGDDSVDNIVSSNIDEITHTYASTGNYTISISGVVRHLAFQHGFIDGNLKEVVQLGKCSWESFNSMFMDCVGLHTVTPGIYDLSNVQDFTSAWRGCTVLTNFPLLLMPAATSLNSTWRYNYALTSFPEIDISGVTNLSSTWINCEGLTSFPLLNTSSVTQASYAWNRCLNLTEFPLLDLSNCTNFGRTWNQCYDLATFPALDMSSATSLYETWRSCALIPSLDDITFGPNIINAEGTFYDCEALTEISYTFGLSSPTNFNNTFIGCKSIVNIHSYDFSAAQTMVQTFAQMTSLVSLPRLETSLCTNFDYTFSGTTMLTCMQSLDTTGANPLDLNKLWSNSVYFITPNSTDRAILSAGAYWENTGTPCYELPGISFYSNYALSLNPTLYFRLGDDTTVAKNEIDGGPDGVHTNGVTLGISSMLADDTDTAIKTDGINQWVNLNSTSSTTSTDSIGTVSIIHRHNTGEGSTVAFCDNTITSRYLLFYSTDTVMGLSYASLGRNNSWTVDFNFIDGEIYHLVWMTNGTDYYHFYINGIRYPGVLNVAHTPETKWVNNYPYNSLGLQSLNRKFPDDTYTEGEVDEFLYFNYELSQEEISNLYRVTTSYSDYVLSLNPIAYWRQDIAVPADILNGYIDDFTGNNGDPLNPKYWQDSTDILISNNAGAITLPRYSAADYFRLCTKHKINGDFTVEIDWDITNGDRQPDTGSAIPFRLVIYFYDINGVYMQFVSIQTYVSSYAPNTFSYNLGSGYVYSSETISETGKFKIARVGNTVTLWYDSGTGWEWDGSSAGISTTLSTEYRALASVYTAFKQNTIEDNITLFDNLSITGELEAYIIPDEVGSSIAVCNNNPVLDQTSLICDNEDASIFFAGDGYSYTAASSNFDTADYAVSLICSVNSFPSTGELGVLCGLSLNNIAESYIDRVLYVDENGYIGFYTNSTGTAHILSNATISLNETVHIVASGPDSGTSKLYINGVKQTAEGSPTEVVGTQTPILSVGNLISSNASFVGLDATIDEVWITGTTPLEADILELYTRGIYHCTSTFTIPNNDLTIFEGDTSDWVYGATGYRSTLHTTTEEWSKTTGEAYADGDAFVRKINPTFYGNGKITNITLTINDYYNTVAGAVGNGLHNHRIEVMLKPPIGTVQRLLMTVDGYTDPSSGQIYQEYLNSIVESEVDYINHTVSIDVSNLDIDFILVRSHGFTSANQITDHGFKDMIVTVAQ